MTASLGPSPIFKAEDGETEVILVVEDEPFSRKALVSLLSASGYEARAVASAEEALHFVEGGPTPYIALVDLNLPGMDGMELIRYWEEHNPSITPVLVTAAAREVVQAAQLGHSVEYIQKPINFSHLLTVIHRV